MNSHQHNIFSVPIWGFILTGQKYESVDYINYLLELEKTEPGVKVSNFGGYQTHDNLHKIHLFRELVLILENLASSCLNQKAIITEMWGNINHKYCYNGAHVHGGALSGVLYLKVPKNSGRLIFCNPAVRSNNQFIKSLDFPIVPENFACIMFPNWLEHYVEQNLSDEPRISISFNFGL